MMNSTLVSILMTCYNREKYIAESIESVLASTYTNFELIIVDDCSKDNTVRIAERFALIDSRIKIFINEKNLGDYPNRNKAASYATGKYLKFLDSDDIIYPWGLAAMVYCMEKFPEAGYGLTSYGLKTNKKFPMLLAPNQAYYTFYFEGSMINSGPTGSIIKRQVFEMEQGFSGKAYVGDTEMWLTMSRKYSLVLMPLDLVWWREHEDQQFKDEIVSVNYEFNRYILSLDALENKRCPFDEMYKSKAIRNFKNRYSRNLVILLSKGKIRKCFRLYRSFNLTPMDFIKSLAANKYPPKL